MGGNIHCGSTCDTLHCSCNVSFCSSAFSSRGQIEHLKRSPMCFFIHWYIVWNYFASTVLLHTMVRAKKIFRYEQYLCIQCDFLAYGMLSGWTTHGRLSCLYCQDSTDAFQLKHGQKTCWFHWRMRSLPCDHSYRKSTTLFTKNMQEGVWWSTSWSKWEWYGEIVKRVLFWEETRHRWKHIFSSWRCWRTTQLA